MKQHTFMKLNMYARHVHDLDLLVLFPTVLCTLVIYIGDALFVLYLYILMSVDTLRRCSYYIVFVTV